MRRTFQAGVVAGLLAAAACSVDSRNVSDLITSSGGTTQCTDAGGCEPSPNPAGCTGCSAAGQCYDENATSPSNACERCASGQWVAKPAGAACNDGLYCTEQDQCTGGQCGGTPRACSNVAASACSSVTCVESAASCQATSLCSPNLFCDQSSGNCQATCDGCIEAGSCFAAGSPRPSNACQLCGTTGSWVAADDGSECDDGLDCTEQACAAGRCEAQAKDVDNGLYCDGTEQCVEGSPTREHVNRPCAEGLCAESNDTCAELEQLVVGGKHSCAWLRLGAADIVQCWGEGDRGQLGYGMENDIGTSADASVAVPTSHRVALNLQPGEQILQLAAGGYHTCVLLATPTSAGEVRCWGDNSRRQLGVDQDVDEVLVNMGQSVQFGLDQGVPLIATKISAGDAHTCAILATTPAALVGKALCWGQAIALGNGDTATDVGGATAPVANAVPLDFGIDPGSGDPILVAKLVGGGFHTCALLSTGAVRCWGFNGSGQLGAGQAAGTVTQASAPAAPDVVLPLAPGVTPKDLDASTNHSCILLSNGALRCFGNDGVGQLGYGNGGVVTDAVTDVPDSVGQVLNATSISLGNQYTCAVLASGQIRCWGRGVDGRLGYGSTSQTSNARFDLTLGASITPAAVIAAGGAFLTADANSDPDSHTCAVLSSGVKCWGANASGELGQNSTSHWGDGNGETPATAEPVRFFP